MTKVFCYLITWMSLRYGHMEKYVYAENEDQAIADWYLSMSGKSGCKPGSMSVRLIEDYIKEV